MSARKCRRCRKRKERLDLVAKLVANLTDAEIDRVTFKSVSGVRANLTPILRIAALRLDP